MTRYSEIARFPDASPASPCGKLGAPDPSRDSPPWETSLLVLVLTAAIYRLASFASRLWNRCRRPLDPLLNRRRSRVWTGRRGSVKQAFDADILVHVRPMNPLAGPNQAELGSLDGRGFGQPPGPGKRHADHASVGQVGDDLVLVTRTF